MKSFKKIRVFLLGGLGNQLFGAFFAHAINSKLPKRVEVSDRFIPFGSNSQRVLIFDQLQEANASKITVKRSPKPIQKLLSKSKILRRIVWHSFRLLSTHKKMKLEDFWRIKQVPSDDIDILDYCDDWFFPEYVRSLDDSFSIDYKFNHGLASFKTESSTGIVCHVRIGDYLKHPDVYTLLDEKYYLSAIQVALEINTTQNSSVILVSEKADEVRKYYPRLTAISSRIIDRDDLDTDLEAFHMLASAQNLVAANSTFSMWAAWFGLLKRNLTIVPHDSSANSLQSGLRELSWKVLDSKTGHLLESRPYASWFNDRENKFHDIISILDSKS